MFRLGGPYTSTTGLLTRLSGPKSLACFPNGWLCQPERRPKLGLVRHPRLWLCGATIAVPQAARYEVVHSRITVVGQSEARLTIVAFHNYTYYQDEG